MEDHKYEVAFRPNRTGSRNEAVARRVGETHWLRIPMKQARRSIKSGIAVEVQA